FASDLDRPPDLRHGQEQASGALLRDRRGEAEDLSLHPLGCAFRAGRSDSGRAILERPRRQRSGLRARRSHLSALGWREHFRRRGHDRRRRAGDLRDRCVAQRTHAGRREPRYAERRGGGASDPLGRRPHPGAPDKRGLAATSADESSQQFMRRLDAMRWRRGSQFALAGMTILVVAACGGGGGGGGASPATLYVAFLPEGGHNAYFDAAASGGRAAATALSG